MFLKQFCASRKQREENTFMFHIVLLLLCKQNVFIFFLVLWAPGKSFNLAALYSITH